MWAQTQMVSYLSPVYNTIDDPTSGIKEWQSISVEATVVTNTITILSTGWYVVSGTDVQTGSLTCQGAVHLILANNAKLTATGGYEQAAIQVSGSNSLTIYAQSTDDAQMGQLVATGGELAAGIGDGYGGSDSNITINGGVVTANGGGYAAGIGGGYGGDGFNIIINGGVVTANGGEFAAGIGGGIDGNGTNITINGGEVTATGGTQGGAGIGGGYRGEGSYIYVATACIVKADNTNPPTTLIGHNANEDLATKLSGKQYVTIVNLTSYKKVATDAIDAAIVGVTDAAVLAIATQAKTDINAATTKEDVVAIKTLSLAKINAIAEINAKIEGVTDTDILAIAEAAKTSISSATTVADIESIKNTALAELEYVVKYYNSGKTEGDAAGYARGLEEGKAEAAAELLGSMGEPCTDCPAVDVTKGTTTIRLYNPEKVEFRKME